MKSMKKFLMWLPAFALVIASMLIPSQKASAATTHVLNPYDATCSVYRSTDASFKMMGETFKQGITGVGSAAYNLDGKVSSVSFTVGHVDGQSNRDVSLDVYFDGVKQEEYTKQLDSVIEYVTIPTEGVKHLKLAMYNSGSSLQKDGVFGIANITATSDSYHEYKYAITKPVTVITDGEITYTCDCGATYKETVPAAKECAELTPFDSKRCDVKHGYNDNTSIVRVNGKYVFDSVVFSGNQYNSIYASYNLGDKYSKIEFTVGTVDQAKWVTGKTLCIYNNDVLIKSVYLTDLMPEQKVEFDASGIRLLKFGIKFDQSVRDGAGEIALYDFVCTKKDASATTAHKFTDKVTLEPKFREEGILEHKCDVCLAHYEEAIPALTRSLKDKEVSISLKDTKAITYSGKAKKPAIVVKYGDEVLTKGTDYTVTYSNNIKAGKKAKIVVKGLDGYKNSASIYFTIEKATNKITLTNTKTTINKKYSTKGQTVQIKASDKSKDAKNITYTSNVKKVKVDKNGKVKIPAKYKGTVKITVTAKSANYETVKKVITIKVK